MKKQKIVGIGWAKTGTTTLGKAMEILGFNHKTQELSLVNDIMIGDYEKTKEIFFKYDSFDDWPWIILYKQLDIICDDCKYILTIRDEKKWLKSYKNMLKVEGKATKEKNEIRSFLYGLDFPNVSDFELLETYKKHNDSIFKYFKYRKDDLLVVDWEKGDGWDKLCNFLSLDIPTSEKFPHQNKGCYL